MKQEFLAHEILIYEYYFNKRIDALNKVDYFKRKYGASNVIVLYFGTNYTDYGTFDYRLTIQIERNYRL